VVCKQICGVLAVLVFSPTLVVALEIFPLSEVRPGLRGETWTVLSGREVVRLETEIVGIAENWVAPGKHLIIGRLVDSRVALSGPVHGMSGSPLFVDGRLVGALSRRLGLFEKDNQCGFTPIEDMLAVWQTTEPTSYAGVGAKDSLTKSASALPTRLTDFDSARRILRVEGGELLLPLASGLREGWWLDFARRLWQGTGVFLLAAGAGASGNAEATGTSLEPGAPVSFALATGDMVLAATGTVTWRDGDKLLALGHPFLGLGDVSLPLCEAEVVTVIPSYMMPFKLANTRREAGVMVRDGISAVTGELGKKADLPKYTISVRYADRETRWSGRFFGHRRFAPVVMATLALRALSAREDLPQEVFFKQQGKVVFRSTDSTRPHREFVLNLNNSGSGDAQAWMDSLLEMIAHLETVLSQGFLELELASFEWSVDVSEGEKLLLISGLELITPRVIAGDQVSVRVLLQDKFGKKQECKVSLQIPHDLSKGEVLTLRALSARELDRRSYGNTPTAAGKSVEASRRPKQGAYPAQSAEEVFSRLNKLGSADELAVVLIRSKRSLRYGTEILEGLPDSVITLLALDRRAEIVQDSVVAERRVKLEGVLCGELTTCVEVEDQSDWF